MKKISNLFGFKHTSLKKNKDIKKKINEFLKFKSRCILEVHINENQEIAPKQVFIKSKKGIGKPSELDNMYPHMSYKSYLDL